MWYKRKTPNGTYYTPFTSSKPTYTYAGPGERQPTPKELCDYLNNAVEKNNDIYVDSSGYITFYSEDVGKHKKYALPDGVYMYGRANSDDPERLIPITLREDAYVDVDGLTKEIKEDIDNFLSNEALYRDPTQPIIYKIGFLMYGPPGNGKTSLLRELLKYKFPKGTVTIFLNHLTRS